MSIVQSYMSQLTYKDSEVIMINTVNSVESPEHEQQQPVPREQGRKHVRVCITSSTYLASLIQVPKFPLVMDNG